jgi:hypothetical protein
MGFIGTHVAVANAFGYFIALGVTLAKLFLVAPGRGGPYT